jgi:hypothetical protein
MVGMFYLNVIKKVLFCRPHNSSRASGKAFHYMPIPPRPQASPEAGRANEGVAGDEFIQQHLKYFQKMLYFNHR